MKEVLKEYRCGCGKLLLRGLIVTGNVEVKCRYCKSIGTIEGLTGNVSNRYRYVLFIDERGFIVRASSTSLKKLGLPPSSLIGTHITDHLVLLDASFLSSVWHTLFSKEEPSIIFKTLEKHRDKSLTPVSIEVQPLDDNAEKTLVFMVEQRSYARELGVGGSV